MNLSKEQGNSPFFSIIVPTYNNACELEKCIDSILAQSYPDFELIIVDDGSVDATPDICDAYAAKDSRVRIIHKENRGVAAARNDGLFCAAGKYVYYADADDWIEQGLLQEAANVLLGQPEPPDIFIFGYTEILTNGERNSYSWPLEFGLYSKERLQAAVYPYMLRYFGTKRRKRRLICPALWDKIIAKDLLLAHYCADISFFCHEDLVCSYECIYFAKRIYFSSSDFYVYNQCSKSSMHRRYHPDLWKNNIATAEYLRSRAKDRNASLTDKQINELEFDGLITAACQEIRFTSSIWNAARRWKVILREVSGFSISHLKGLNFPARICVLLFHFRIVYPSMQILKLLCWIKGIPTKIETGDRMYDADV